MVLYDEFVALGNGSYNPNFPAEAALNKPFPLRPEGHVMAWRYSKVFDLPGGTYYEDGDAIQFWTVELRASSEAGAAVLFRQRVKLRVHLTLDEETYEPVSYTLTTTVTTTNIGGLEIDAADAANYLDIVGSGEYVITDEFFEASDGVVAGVFNSGAYFMDVPPGAAFAITEGSWDGTLFDFELFQRNVFPVPLSSTVPGVVQTASRVAGNSYLWSLWHIKGSEKEEQLKADNIASVWQNARGQTVLARRLIQYSGSVAETSVVFDNHIVGGPIGGEMWSGEFRFVAAAQTRDGSLITCAVRGRQFGEPVSTPTSLWFRRISFDGNAVSWGEPVKIADLETLEPFGICQKWPSGSAQIVVTNGRDLIYTSDDFGRTWAQL